ncbi:MAG: acyltransferase [Rhizobium sp.]
MEENRRYFYTLDALRGIAAIMVVIHHAGQRTLSYDPLPFSFLAVDIFFILSGIVIAMTYDRQLGSSMTPASFMMRRLTRLYPLYLLGLVLAIVAACFNGGAGFAYASSLPVWLLTIVASLLFLPSFLLSTKSEAFPLNYPAWSLFYELLINLAYALLFRSLTLPRLVAFAAVNLILYIVAVRLARTPDMGWGGIFFFAGLFRVGYGFAIGVIIARMLSVQTPRVNSLMTVAICIALVALLAAPIYQGRNLAGILAVAFASPALVFVACIFEPKSEVLKRFSLLMGRISYPLYMIHAPILYYLTTNWRFAAGNELAMVSLLVLWLAGLSLFIEMAYDLPVRKRLSAALKAGNRATRKAGGPVAAMSAERISTRQVR